MSLVLFEPVPVCWDCEAPGWPFKYGRHLEPCAGCGIMTKRRSSAYQQPLFTRKLRNLLQDHMTLDEGDSREREARGDPEC